MKARSVIEIWFIFELRSIPRWIWRKARFCADRIQQIAVWKSLDRSACLRDHSLSSCALRFDCVPTLIVMYLAVFTKVECHPPWAADAPLMKLTDKAPQLTNRPVEVSYIRGKEHHCLFKSTWAHQQDKDIASSTQSKDNLKNWVWYVPSKQLIISMPDTYSCGPNHEARPQSHWERRLHDGKRVSYPDIGRKVKFNFHHNIYFGPNSAYAQLRHSTSTWGFSTNVTYFFTTTQHANLRSCLSARDTLPLSKVLLRLRVRMTLFWWSFLLTPCCHSYPQTWTTILQVGVEVETAAETKTVAETKEKISAQEEEVLEEKITEWEILGENSLRGGQRKVVVNGVLISMTLQHFRYCQASHTHQQMRHRRAWYQLLPMMPLQACRTTHWPGKSQMRLLHSREFSFLIVYTYLANHDSSPDQMVTFFVGHEETRFLVHKQNACNASPVLNAAFNGNFSEDRTKTYDLDDVEPAVFWVFMQFLYSKTLVVSCHNLDPQDDVSNPSDNHFTDCYKQNSTMDRLWILADKFLMTKLQNLVVDQIVRTHQDCTWSIHGITSTDCHRVYNNTPVGSPLRRLLVERCAWRCKIFASETDYMAEKMVGFPVEMLVDMINTIQKARKIDELLRKRIEIIPASFYVWCGQSPRQESTDKQQVTFSEYMTSSKENPLTIFYLLTLILAWYQKHIPRIPQNTICV